MIDAFALNAVAPDWNLKAGGRISRTRLRDNAVAPDWNLKCVHMYFDVKDVVKCSRTRLEFKGSFV